MGRPAYSVKHSAVAAQSVGNGAVGDVLIVSTDPDDEGRYVKATTANRGSRRSEGVALQAYSAGVSVDFAVGGFRLSADETGLSSGAEEWAIVSAMGRLSRCATASLAADDDIIGKAHADGSVTLFPGTFTYAQATAASTVANDIGRSGGGSGPINRVLGFLGRLLSLITPKDGETYAYDAATNTHIPAGRKIHVKRFGAVADGTTDCADAIEEAINSVSGIGSGIVEFDPTDGGSFYRVSRKIEIPVSTILKGHGGQHNYAGTVVKADAGVTAFHVPFAAPDTVFEDMTICAAGRDTTTTTGTWTFGSTTVTVADGSDFSDGQLIQLRGCERKCLYQEVTAATTSGSPTVALTGTGDQTPFAFVGQHLTIGTAFPNPTKVTAVAGTTLTMASNAATTISASPVYDRPPLYAFIVSGGGTNTWEIDTDQLGDSTLTTLTGVEIGHADAGIVWDQSPRMNRVCIGGPVNGSILGFQGQGILCRGNLGDTPPKYASSGRVNDCRIYGCGGGLFVTGADANAGRYDVTVIQPHNNQWCIQDVTTLGNAYMAGTHGDGGAAYITLSSPSHNSEFFGTYVEAGSYVSLGAGSWSFGGSMPRYCGGTSFGGDGEVNRITIGNLSFTTHQTRFLPNNGYAEWLYASNDIIRWFTPPSTLYGAGAIGWAMVTNASSNGRNHPISIAFHNNAATFKAGSLVLAQGAWLGEDQENQLADFTQGAWFGSLRSSTTGRGAVIYNPYIGPVDSGDTTFSAESVAFTKGAVVRDPNLLDGAPFRVVVEGGKRAQEWKANTAVALNEYIVPTVNNHNGRRYKCTTAGTTDATTEPDWTTAPNLNDTRTDGTVTWTNVSEAAYTQPIDIGGRIDVAAAADATWTSSTRAFLCERVKVTGSPAGTVTLTLPAGRWKRWFWNAYSTAQSLALKCSSGRTITIANNRGAWVGCDGSQMERLSADVDPTA